MDNKMTTIYIDYKGYMYSPLSEDKTPKKRKFNYAYVIYGPVLLLCIAMLVLNFVK